MPDLIRLRNRQANERLRAYYDDLDKLTGRALLGRVDENEFRQELNRLMTAAFTLLFVEAGGNLADAAARAELDRIIAQNVNSVTVLTGDVFDGRYSRRSDDEAAPGRPPQTATEGRDKLRNRLALWVFTAAGLWSAGKIYGQAEQTAVWRLGNTEEHCTTCLALDGVVLTKQEWQQLRYRPQARNLACGGWRCDCELQDTDRESIGLENVRV